MTDHNPPAPVGTPAGNANRAPLGPLTASEVCYRRAGRTILDQVSLTAHPGQALAVTGPSGSGKSSLLALLAGLEQPDSGTVQRDPPQVRLGLILQAYGLASLLTAAENIEIVLQANPTAGVLTRADIAARTAAALHELGLTPFADHLVEELSGGQQQRVAIARALVVEPQILLADEFTAELDYKTKQRARGLILDVSRRGGIVVIATHDPDIADHCDHVLHLIDGRARPER